MISVGELSSRGAKDLLAIIYKECSAMASVRQLDTGDQNLVNPGAVTTEQTLAEKPQKGLDKTADSETSRIFPVSAKALAEKNGLIQKSNAADIVPAIEKVIADNASVVDEYKKGKAVSLQFLIGQAMKATKGAANPEVVKKLLMEKLS